MSTIASDQRNLVREGEVASYKLTPFLSHLGRFHRALCLYDVSRVYVPIR